MKPKLSVKQLRVQALFALSGIAANLAKADRLFPEDEVLSRGDRANIRKAIETVHAVCGSLRERNKQ